MLNVITLFSGYDSQALALNRLGVDYDLVAWCEIDKYAIKAHNALFPQYADRNLGDVSKVVWSDIKEPIDLLTYSSPCQDFSQAGLQRGGEKGSGTRSGLLWECERAIGELKPKYLVFENVPALVSEKFIDTFLAWGRTLHTMGYRNYWQCLNAKNYGVPQNRNRVFMVSVYGEGEPYYFPKKVKLERRLKDLLEKEVDESYYLSEERIRNLLASTEKESGRGNGFGFMPKDPDECDTSSAVLATMGSRKTDNFIIEPQVLGWTRDEKGNIIDRHPVDIANCVTSGKRDNTQNFVQEAKIRIRRLTERELFRLMDVDDADIDTLLSAGIAKTQLAKMAGNSIVVNVLYHIFKRLLVDTEAQNGEQMKLF